MPGSLAPGDIERIANFCGVECDSHFLESHFAASDGPIVRIKDKDGLKDTHIPTIVPQQKEDGSCVFLDENNKCSIHPVAPFGCRNFKVCDPPSYEDSCKSAHMLREVVATREYLMAWSFLTSLGIIVEPLLDRRKNLNKALAELD